MRSSRSVIGHRIVVCPSLGGSGTTISIAAGSTREVAAHRGQRTVIGYWPLVGSRAGSAIVDALNLPAGTGSLALRTYLTRERPRHPAATAAIRAENELEVRSPIRPIPGTPE